MHIEGEKLLDLIQRSKAGDLEAQEALVQAAQNRVYYHCKKMLKNEADAQDATQDVLIAMLTGLDKLREPAAFWGWVNGITANRCKHLLSTPNKTWQIPEDEDGNSMLDDLESMDEQLIPDKALDNAETRRMILDLVDNLPPAQRMSVLFYYYDEMSVKEIAQAMEVSEGTVKSRLNYARKAIRDGVEAYERKGVKLYSVSPLLLLAFFLRQEGAASALDGAAAAAMVGQVMAQAGGAAAGGSAAGATVTAAAESAAGTAGTGAAASGAGAATAAAGISTKVIAAILAGAVVIGGTVAGITLASNREDGAVTPTPALADTPAVSPEAETPDSQPIDADAFGAIHGFSIVAPRAYTDMPVTLVLNDANLVPLPSASALTQPVISVNGPDGTGYVTYTVTYTITAQSYIGATSANASLDLAILVQDYNFYDYYTGQLYLPTERETDAGGVYTSGSATVERDGETITVYFEKNWQSGMDYGDWTESDRPEAAREICIDSYMSAEMVVRVPVGYDGVLLGLNVIDSADPEKAITEAWNLETDNPAHYQFVRLSDQAK